MTARLEDLTPGAPVRGLVPGEPVTVVAVEWHGDAVVTLTYRRTSGEVGSELVYRADEARLDLDGTGEAWAFDADGALFRLAAEARRIRLAHLFDPRLAVHLSLLEPLPHQIQAVYGAMLPRHPLRFALCDDPGAGKTIMAGLYIKELLLRGDLRRCLIVAPGGLVAQWQDELSERFGLAFAILTRDMIEASATADPFVEHNLLIARLDHLSRNDDLVERLRRTEWDLAVVDEAHRMSAHRFGGEVKETRRYRLGKALAQVARHFLLMTATPHDGKDEDFHLFLALLDPDRFEGRPTGETAPDVSDLLRRMVKERLLRFDGRPLFPERRATTVTYPLSEGEAELYARVTDYVREEMNLADRLAAEGEGRRGNRVGFAATVLQRRLASSPEAIYQSLSRRRGRLSERLDLERAGAPAATTTLADRGPEVDEDDLEDLDGDEIEALEQAVVDDATAARTLAELEIEIATLGRLEALADSVRRSGTDRKWTELVGLLDGPEMVEESGTRRKLIVFTEHRDTLNHLVGRLRTWFGRPGAVVAIHGGVRREERRRLQEVFTQDKDCVVMVATDAAGEGINLQRAHLLVNYDLPWNPNRIEQRFGRVHRIGQQHVCHLWNLVAEDTREGQVYARLLTKLEEQRKALGGQVWDVLGVALPGRALRDLLIEAIRYGDRPDVRARLDAVVDAAVGEGLADLVAEQALAADALDLADVERIRRDLLEAEARRLQPHYVRAWFADAFGRLGGRMAEREAGRFEVTRVPEPVRNAAIAGAVVLPTYERVTFDKERARPEGAVPADLLAPGHPLLEAVLGLTLDQLGPLLRRGTVLVDDTDAGDAPRVLVFFEHAVTDGHETPGGRRVVSRRFEFVELRPDGTASSAGYAPYLDHRPATAEESALVGKVLADPWLASGVEAAVFAHAVEVAVPAHLAEVRSRTLARVAKVRAAVRDRLTKQIAYWDARAEELRGQADAGRQPRMNPDRAQARADDLAGRLAARMIELDREEQLAALPPVVVGAALVVPAGLLARLGGQPPEPPPAFALERKLVEQRAVDAVVAAEEALGYDVTVMAPNNPGFDLRSEGQNGELRFVEVKGRIAGADQFMVTRNEILRALNVPHAWLLALVEVSPEGPAGDRVRYLRQPFGATVHLPFDTTATVLSWPDYWDRGEAPS
ncbi:MAG TPA: helicase-related protein [Acidimicrobiales bacterium]|nr:helicase-related protein [Acidimicrobiales bacterium]